MEAFITSLVFTALVVCLSVLIGEPTPIVLLILATGAAWISHIPELPTWARLVGWSGALLFGVLAALVATILSI